jgi:hypothetical protein
VRGCAWATAAVCQVWDVLSDQEAVDIAAQRLIVDAVAPPPPPPEEEEQSPPAAKELEAGTLPLTGVPLRCHSLCLRF